MEKESDTRHEEGDHPPDRRVIITGLSVFAVLGMCAATTLLPHYLAVNTKGSIPVTVDIRGMSFEYYDNSPVVTCFFSLENERSQEQLEHLIELRKLHPESSLTIIAACDPSARKRQMVAFARKHNFPFPVLRAESEVFSSVVSGGSLPAISIKNPLTDGNRIFRGITSEENITDILRKMGR